MFTLSLSLKRRKRVLKGAVRTRLNEILQSVAIDKEWIIKALEIAPDHVHLLVEYDSTHSIGQVAQAFQGVALLDTLEKSFLIC